MKLGTLISDETQGMILFETNRAPIACTFEGKKVFIKQKCKGCGSNEVKDYKCAYCGNKI